MKYEKWLYCREEMKSNKNELSLMAGIFTATLLWSIYAIYKDIQSNNNNIGLSVILFVGSLYFVIDMFYWYIKLKRQK